jgi:geranylgeranyl diphosphate synthase type II
VYGEAMAVLSGDALLTDAFCAAAMAKLPNPADMATAIGVLSECAGSHGMVGGQVLDIMSEERLLSEQEVLDIQSRKTGALIRAACALGAIAGGATQAQYDAACQFAAALGLAFQIRDDMLDVIGSQEEMGKGVGTDANKNTFVRLYGLEKCEELVQTYTDYALQALNVFDDTRFITELARSLTARRT